MKKQKNKSGWNHFPHIADMGITGYGPTISEAFTQAALAMTAIITEPQKIQPQEKISIQCSAEDYELLLVEWLSQIIYQMSARDMLFSHFHVKIENHNLTAQIYGEKTDPKKHTPSVEIKGATYTALSVVQKDDGTWNASCVVDI